MNLSERKFSKRIKPHNGEDIIHLQDILLEYILVHRWKDYDRFAITLSTKILSSRPRSVEQLFKIVLSTAHPFFRFNNLSKAQFLRGLPAKAILGRIVRRPVVTLNKSTVPPKRRLQIGARLRILILERDHFRCKLCGRGPSDTSLEVDHIV